MLGGWVVVDVLGLVVGLPAFLARFLVPLAGVLSVAALLLGVLPVGL